MMFYVNPIKTTNIAMAQLKHTMSILVWSCIVLSFSLGLSQNVSADDNPLAELTPKVTSERTSETISLAILNYENNQLVIAKQHFQAILNQRPSENVALYYLGRIAYDQGDAENAILHLRNALDFKPNTADEYYWLARAYADHARSAGAFKGAILAKNIKKYAERAVESDPKSIHALRLLIDFHLFAPWIIGGSTDSAKENIDKLANVSVLDADIKRLALMKRLAQTDNALKAANKLMQTHSTSVEALHLAGLTYQENRLYNEAFRCFDKALALPLTADSTYYLNKVKYRYAETALWSNTNTQAAIEVLSDLLNSTKNNRKYVRTWPTWTLAKLYLSLGDRSQYRLLRDSLAKSAIREDDVLNKDIDKFNTLYHKNQGL
ncbi:tetratricopeptide repeat protein [Algibacillus agarilyticus]|uniref:tetratricopeptide repeat protein n=1 Tax=Algibacillus agarilyticus TaxID=2234133 RepID=UPI000DD079BC|nr:tetratricopeptide repeat protein [Algibacillus agarilyticus]